MASRWPKKDLRHGTARSLAHSFATGVLVLERGQSKPVVTDFAFSPAHWSALHPYLTLSPSAADFNTHQPLTLPTHLLGSATGVPNAECGPGDGPGPDVEPLRDESMPHGIGQTYTGRYAQSAQVSLACDDRPMSGAPGPQPSKSAKAAEHTLHPVVKALVCASFRRNGPSKRNHSARRANTSSCGLHFSARNGGAVRGTSSITITAYRG
ncbi:uncharacterized protein CC84DRAFT_129891 [Paraphaeosphaeria sporulosa]|uniref:Uncharacterized protein n=1 Tax=Paraphaeosphaeria sporulosa TaxID=1460663 RepID=A0A177CYH8_9PLEO|nr:uncharacterized protein CC84DRAFT_129891 [Paraphaeosphaeria sporulosa]OAG12605.1 hypothetical protein CC84DRAFT_129891 [Paraphaeosphaeria sporulosa]